MKIEHRTVDTGEGRIALRICGEGPADVVLLHGIPGSARSWDTVLPLLGDGVRAFVPDLAGFGASWRPRAIAQLHAEGQARGLEQALRAAGAERPVLVGHDFGGPVAVRMIMRAPVAYRGLAVAATNLFADTPVPFPLSLVRTPLLGRAFERVLFSRLSLRMMCRAGAKAARVDAAAAVGDGSQAAAIRAIFAESLRRLPELYGPIERALASFDVPAMVLWGERDMFFSTAHGERTARALRAELRILPGCGHFLPEEDPTGVATAIREFAERIELHQGRATA